MNLANYPDLARRTEKALPSMFERLEHAALGLVTETGEIATVVKRIAIYGKSLDDFEKDGVTTLRAHILEEAGDVMWYLPIITRELCAHDVFSETTVVTGAPSLASMSRRLSIAAGRIASYVEDSPKGYKTDVDLRTEVREILRVLTCLCYKLGTTLEDVAGQNIEKLRLRFPEAYSDTAAEARADKGGEDARNS